ncbi:CidA/LrgA family holin-like protein [Solibacillus sp. FSL H8-0538]|uniref:CidA/LrgA family holin-like protein n=1 Tax=Solibacillus sp. FSL H8-0538 TaxID=2921400 RepID=UPI0030F5F4F3
MRVLRIMAQIAILFVYYYIGTLIVDFTGIIIPGSIIGLVLLWLTLYFKLIKVEFIQDGAGFLLAFLTLFFIPSTVAVVNYPELLSIAGAYLVIAVIVSTICTIVITGKVSQFIEKRENQEKEATDVVATPSNASHHR